jgi:hypothetical protein
MNTYAHLTLLTSVTFERWSAMNATGQKEILAFSFLAADVDTKGTTEHIRENPAPRGSKKSALSDILIVKT